MKIEGNRFGAWLYNQDRAIASLIWKTTQETISSEVGRILIGAGKPDGWTPRYKWQADMAIALANWLNRDHWLWGYNHTAKAIAHADKLDHADDGVDQ